MIMRIARDRLRTVFERPAFEVVLRSLRLSLIPEYTLVAASWNRVFEAPDR